VREVEGVPCLQREDFDAAVASQPNVAIGMTIRCGTCQGLLHFVDFARQSRVLQFRCASCGAPACSPVIPESAAAAGGEVPIVTGPAVGGPQ
jgi:hypothetical protein